MSGINYLDMARTMSRAQFAAAWKHPFIVFGRLGETTEPEFRPRSPGALGWQTVEAPQPDSSTTLDQPSLSEEGAPQPIGAVLPVVKSTRNPYSDRIAVGRSRSNDIVLLSPQVSKLHAHLLPGPDGSWDLRDAGSSNGTFHFGVRLKPEERVRLVYGDTIRFGVLETRFLEPSQLYDWLLRGLAKF